VTLSFYARAIYKAGIPRDAHILVVCGGDYNRVTLRENGFEHVTISNVDERVKGDEFLPFHWSFQDAECLSFPDESFDYVLVHAGLHHCASPHRALLEMYRVAKRGILVIEARDSFLMRFAIRVGRVPAYETAAVRAHGFKYGGVRNTSTPNFIYRWTEREVQKTLASYAPQARIAIRFFYGLRIPENRLPFRSHSSHSYISFIIGQAVKLLAKLAPAQGNLFGFYVKKPRNADLFPWMKSKTLFNENYQGI
jgi:SAM-dependent methyltransferase